MAYLTDWRLTVAADLLRESDATVEAVARRVGYGGAFAFSAALKRERGVSPHAYRTGARRNPSVPERHADSPGRTAASTLSP